MRYPFKWVKGMVFHLFDRSNGEGKDLYGTVLDNLGEEGISVKIITAPWAEVWPTDKLGFASLLDEEGSVDALHSYLVSQGARLPHKRKSIIEYAHLLKVSAMPFRLSPLWVGAERRADFYWTAPMRFIKGKVEGQILPPSTPCGPLRIKWRASPYSRGGEEDLSPEKMEGALLISCPESLMGLDSVLSAYGANTEQQWRIDSDNPHIPSYRFTLSSYLPYLDNLSLFKAPPDFYVADSLGAGWVGSKWVECNTILGKPEVCS